MTKDVLVEGKALIKAGTPVIGYVSLYEPPGLFGNPEVIVITVESVKAVNAQNVRAT
ncbi:MAG: hypothetical protein SFT81_07330 [Candidatus Caenarcaniphilales bacterium]|nr:hypothetical protein [Candidatus Caenarcaniphilales bacterium]